MSKYDHLLKILDELEEQPPASPPLRALTLDDVAERIGSWLKVTDNPPRNCTKAWKDLADETSDFALGCWAYPAVMTGWSDTALFAIDEGLIPEKLRRGFHLMNVESDAATVMNSKGELEHFRRPRTMQPPWWQDEKCIGRLSVVKNG